ncbi:Uncharacterised protein [Mycobacteroides abscessus subsp. abscessus]|nr:Uncharacterised protein [Mycobacteroides abscessus subsp. abscessus]SIN02777.1 Uncharacterised protein [Mycobacteroides abscessus subsp. abscessus]SIN09907.1 Uncharacterised protein [Mycobacteroides abscessus subsp. abscessus]
MLTVQFMQIFAGALASELVSCVDGLLVGPPPGWSERDEDDEGLDDGDEFDEAQHAHESQEG